MSQLIGGSNTVLQFASQVLIYNIIYTLNSMNFNRNKFYLLTLFDFYIYNQKIAKEICQFLH
jgi:hypothetical protein